jgi:hypothetical protein
MIVLVVAACTTDSGSESGPVTTRPSSTTTPPQAGPPDLQIDSVWVEASQAPGFDHDLVMIVTNHGDSDASGFGAGCEWSCPGGTIGGAGADATVDGYVAGNGSFTYTSPFRVQCAGPPGSLVMTCDVDYRNDLAEVREDNNRWQGTVGIP